MVCFALLAQRLRCAGGAPRRHRSAFGLVACRALPKLSKLFDPSVPCVARQAFACRAAQRSDELDCFDTPLVTPRTPRVNPTNSFSRCGYFENVENARVALRTSRPPSPHATARTIQLGAGIGCAPAFRLLPPAPSCRISRHIRPGPTFSPRSGKLGNQTRYKLTPPCKGKAP